MTTGRARTIVDQRNLEHVYDEPGFLSMTFRASVPADARRGGSEAEKQYPAPDRRYKINISRI